MKAVVLAGGRGKRLYPHTTVFPKPLMPVGEVPIIDILLRQLSSYGFKKITLAVGYLSDLIKTYVGNGSDYGLKVEYSLEKKPLGTIGPLSLLKGVKETFLVMNGDLLTDTDLYLMYKSHVKSGCPATLAVKKRKVTVDLGVVEFDKKMKLISHREKPVLSYHVGMGICYFEPEILKIIPKQRKFDFPDIVNVLMKRKMPMNVFKSDSYWRDVGRWEDYLSAQREFPKIKKRIINKNRKKVGKL